MVVDWGPVLASARTRQTRQVLLDDDLALSLLALRLEVTRGHSRRRQEERDGRVRGADR